LGRDEWHKAHKKTEGPVTDKERTRDRTEGKINDCTYVREKARKTEEENRHRKEPE
jgi:hypothetical protein